MMLEISFISNHTLEETLIRAEKYAEAGADAILVHSKKTDASEIKSFMQNWRYRKTVPVVIVPTKYYKTPADEFERMGIRMVIWANHNIRGEDA
jgi:phosphoenolpyruvate phosphomutase